MIALERLPDAGDLPCFQFLSELRDQRDDLGPRAVEAREQLLLQGNRRVLPLTLRRKLSEKPGLRTVQAVQVVALSHQLRLE